MNVVAHKARHPQLRDYIHHSLTALIPSIEKVSLIFASEILFRFFI